MPPAVKHSRAALRPRPGSGSSGSSRRSPREGEQLRLPPSRMTRKWKAAEQRHRAAPQPTTTARRVSESGRHGARCREASAQGPARDEQRRQRRWDADGRGRARTGAEGRGTDLMRCRRPLLPDAFRGGVVPEFGSGSGAKGRRSRGPRGASRSRYLLLAAAGQPCPQHVRRAGSSAAAVRGDGAEAHFALDASAGFKFHFFLSFLSFF